MKPTLFTVYTFLDVVLPFFPRSNCQDKIRDFVREGFKKKILPLPVSVICVACMVIYMQTLFLSKFVISGRC